MASLHSPGARHLPSLCFSLHISNGAQLLTDASVFVCSKCELKVMLMKTFRRISSWQSERNRGLWSIATAIAAAAVTLI